MESFQCFWNCFSACGIVVESVSMFVELFQCVHVWNRSGVVSVFVNRFSVCGIVSVFVESFQC